VERVGEVGAGAEGVEATAVVVTEVEKEAVATQLVLQEAGVVVVVSAAGSAAAGSAAVEGSEVETVAGSAVAGLAMDSEVVDLEVHSEAGDSEAEMVAADSAAEMAEAMAEGSVAKTGVGLVDLTAVEMAARWVVVADWEAGLATAAASATPPRGKLGAG
jgi:hypothetical protein